MADKHLITPQEVFALSRNSSSSIDVRDVEVYIDEAEQLDLKPTIGAALLLRLLNNEGNGGHNYDLLNGGKYKRPCGEVATFAGIRKTLAYYVYGRIIKNGGRTATRYGFVEKTDEYSRQVDYRERYAASNDATLVADSYMKETLNYIEDTGYFDEYKGCGKGMRNRRVTIKVIGD